MRWRLLVFDLDGTLADTQDDLADAVNATRAWAGQPPLALPEIRLSIGDGAKALIQRTVPFSGPVEEPLRYFIGYYGTHAVVRTRLYPGAMEVLEASRPLTRAVLTNKPERISRRMLKALDIAGHFESVIGGDTLPTRKPDPAGLLSLTAKHGVPAAETLLIGDSPVDVATAKAAGIACAAVRGGYAAPGALEASGPEYLLGSLAELIPLLPPR